MLHVMAWFRKSRDRKDAGEHGRSRSRDLAFEVDQLENRIRQLEQHEAARDTEQLEYVARMQKLVRRVLRAERESGPVTEPPGAAPAPPRSPVPPPGLIGARRRIWERTHGRPSLRSGELSNGHTAGSGEAVESAEE